MEVIARTEYMAGDSRDPVASSLFYFTLGKHKLVQGLWRQAAWHKEQAVMLQFLSNDFTQPRWKTAALKNAYALLGKRRFGEWHHLSFGHQTYGEDARIRGCIFHSWR
jgi:RAVE protein 1 C terminal